jgi:hypothetical protein
MSDVSGTTVQPVFRRIPGIFMLLGLICVFAQVHWLLWYYVDIDADAQKLLAETAAGGVIGLIYGFLPSLNKRFVQLKLRQLLGSSTTLSAVVVMAVTIAVVGTLLNRTKIRWPAAQVDIQIDGRRIGSDNWAGRRHAAGALILSANREQVSRRGKGEIYDGRG